MAMTVSSDKGDGIRMKSPAGRSSIQAQKKDESDSQIVFGTKLLRSNYYIRV